MKNWVVLFVKTGAEEKLLRMLKEKLNFKEYLPFLPARETPRRNKGVIYKERKILFSGYIFIQTEIEADLIAKKLNTILTKIKEQNIKGHNEIYSILYYGDNKNDVALKERERLAWERMFDNDFCIRGSVGFIDGENIRITSGVLLGMECKIKKINRHKREALVELEMMGAVREVKLMLEVVEKR
jgi:transcriptional antiterminator NusG